MSGEAIMNIGKNALNLVANTTNQAIKTADALAVAGLDTGEKVGTVALTTVAGTTTAAGDMIVASAQTASSVVGIVRDLAKRTQEISKEAAKRQIDVENLKNSEIKRLTTVGKVNNEEKTKTEIDNIKAKAANEKLQIEKDAANKKLQIEIKADHEKRVIEANDETTKIKQQMAHQMERDELLTNERNYKESLAYGFQTDKHPYLAGSKKIKTWFKSTENQYFGYYILISIIEPKTFVPFELHPKDLSEEQIQDITRERKQNQFTYKDQTGKEVRVVFQKKYKNNLLFNLTETTPDILVFDTITNTQITSGIPVFLKKSYFIPEKKNGGNSRRKNMKQTKNSRRKNMKQTKNSRKR
jgi:hypothetical protein